MLIGSVRRTSDAWRLYYAAFVAIINLSDQSLAPGQSVSGNSAPLPTQVSALFEHKCTACHGEKKQESGLDLRTLLGALKGGDSGPGFVVGHAKQSLIYQRIAAAEMPPEKQDQLTEAEVALVGSWINEAQQLQDSDPSKASTAEFERRSRHWSFLKPKRPAIPKVTLPEKQSPATSAIDAFVFARLQEAKLASAPVADRRTLIRRASFDLLGLPPTPDRVNKFVADTDPQAYEKLIDELLASPQYGERWARHWLDVARYADTGGYETDIYYKNSWRYRDYVVKSFNDDKPYDTFVQEQIAGDELWSDNLDLNGTTSISSTQSRHLEAHVGTGFYALGPEIHESNMDSQKLRNEQLTDWADTTGAAFLGLTIGCARCHDHKFDPITQRDYYGLQAVFAGSKVVEEPIVTAMKIADQKQHYPALLAVDEARRAYRLFEKSLAGRKPTSEEESRLQDHRKTIADAVLAIPEVGLDSLLEVPTASVLAHEQPDLVRPVRLLSRGDVERPKSPIPALIPQVLANVTSRDSLLGGPFESRKQFALWLTQPDHPLTARVLVNRIWAWHFGRGLVETSNDFGHMGQPPSHPKLLDWLATEFTANGWSIKHLHRLIMLSRTYQQSSDFSSDEHVQIDPDNRLLWRMNRRRLEAESLWDTVHAVAGTLNLEMGGRPVMPPLANEELTNKAVWTVSGDPKQQVRRGLYIIVRRNFRFPLFDVFDAPVNAVSCGERDCSTVAPQALWLLNNRTAFGQAQEFAARLVHEVGEQPDAWVNRAWELALGRAPSEDERRDSARLLTSLETENATREAPKELSAELSKLPPARAAALCEYCLALFNLNEFVFID